MSSTFSSRSSTVPGENRLTAALARARSSGREIIDLTVSNPTAVGLDYPGDEIAAALAKGSLALYEPAPLGLPSAREAIARHLGCDPADVLITASTSEAYSFLFKLLADPGDEILTPRPAYPLLEHLASVESCSLRQVPLQYEPRVGWSIDVDHLRDQLTDAVRAVVLVHPNNPTGSFVRPDEARAIASICAERNIALVSDEVFLPYPLETPQPPPSLADLDLPCLTFALGGLSKSGGMPHLKLGWIRLSGSDDLKRQAISRLELIADNFLSVATPVQAALDELLRISETSRARISSRARENLASLRRSLEHHPHVECLTIEGGWSAVLRIPSVMTDEALAIRLIERAGVLVHPGHFFDFEKEGFLVMSLLAERFTEGIERVLDEISVVI